MSYKPYAVLCGRKGELFMPCTEAYKEHIEYTFDAFCRVVIHYAAINAWRDRDKRRQREISFEYLTEEKFYPFCTSDTYFIDPYKQYPVTICGQRVILTNGNLAEALSSLPEKKREIIYLYFFGRYTQQEIGELYGRAYMGTFRTTFLINEEGIIERIITPKEVKTKEHAAQILQ